MLEYIDSWDNSLWVKITFVKPKIPLNGFFKSCAIIEKNLSFAALLSFNSVSIFFNAVISSLTAIKLIIVPNESKTGLMVQSSQ